MTIPSDVRNGFRAIASGWAMLGFHAITLRIEELAAWVKENGGDEACTDFERVTIRMMIESQIAMGDQE